MKNTNLLLSYNSYFIKNYKFENGWIVIDAKTNKFTSTTIKKIISIVNEIHRRYKNKNIPIRFELGYVRFSDKLTYVTLECILYQLMVDYGHDIKISFMPQLGIDVEGIYSSPLLLLSSSKREKRMLFIEKFELDIYKNHFRRIVCQKNIGILDDLNYFLNNMFDIDNDSREDVCEVISELISNSTEHGAGECLIDIDVTNLYNKVDSSGDFYGINIVVLNLCDVLLGTQIRSRITSEDFKTDRYKNLKRAYDYHKQFFDELYLDEDFFSICSFQNKISGRSEQELTGGTGLTMLIESLEQKSDNNMCYVLSGDRIICFEQKYLKYNNDWIGFNESNNFLTDIPNASIFRWCDIYFPGTAYNLHFIMERVNERNID